MQRLTKTDIFCSVVQQPLTDDEARILKIVLAEHLEKLDENGVKLDLAISGEMVITKQRVVECLHNIGQISLAKVLDNKQGETFIPQLNWGEPEQASVELRHCVHVTS